MKNRNRNLEIADLKAVGHWEDDLVLFIAGEDPNIPVSLCVQADFNASRFDPVQPMSVYLATKSYKRIHDGDRRISYRQRILEEMSPEVIDTMLKEFTRQRQFRTSEEVSSEWNPSWEHPYGT